MEKLPLEHTLRQLAELLNETAGKIKGYKETDAVDSPAFKELLGFYQLVYQVTERTLRLYASDNPQLEMLLEDRLFSIELELVLGAKKIRIPGD